MHLYSICLTAACGAAATILALDLGGQLAEHPDHFVRGGHPETVCAQYGDRGSWRCADADPARVVWSAAQ